MPTFICPNCEWRASPRRQIHTGAKIRCSHCHTVFSVAPDLALDPIPIAEEAKVIQPKPKEGTSGGLPWYKDPILRWAWILPAIVFSLFFCYLGWQKYSSHKNEAVMPLFREAEKLALRKENRAAYQKYQELLSFVGRGDPGTDELRHSVEVARSESVRLYSIAKQEIDEDVAQRAKFKREIIDGYKKPPEPQAWGSVSSVSTWLILGLGVIISIVVMILATKATAEGSHDGIAEAGKPISIFWVLVFLVWVIGTLTNAGKNSSSPSSTSGKPYDMPEKDWNYVTNRVEHGANVSRSEAEEAARAVWKFEKSQGR